MATTTPNYGWTVPTSSDLVKNGATAIETLGDSVDDSLWSSGYGQAGKNKIINGDFTINQRNFSSTTTNGDYGFDRWALALSGATATYSAQTFTPGAAPVAGYESKNFARLVTTVGNDGCRLQQPIEDVRTFAGQTVTLSFWAKGTNPTTAGNLAANFIQNFGTGGSPSAQVTVTQQTFVLTANWTRYSLTFAIPSISGKTIGTTPNTSCLQLFIGQGSSLSTDAWTLDLWGVQLEYGSKATPFQTASGGSIQGELAMCQRYLPAITTASASDIGTGYNVSTTQPFIMVPFQVPARVAPTGITATATNFGVRNTGGSVITLTAIAFNNASPMSGSVLGTVASGLVAGQGTTMQLTGTLLFTGCEL
jgi:hypothetical protein